MGEASAKNACEMDGNRELGPLKYFTAECFEESAALASQFRISYKRSRKLVRGVVSIFFLSAAAVPTAEGVFFFGTTFDLVSTNCACARGVEVHHL